MQWLKKPTVTETIRLNKENLRILTNKEMYAMVKKPHYKRQ